MTKAIQLSEVSLWRRTQEEYSYDFKKTILSWMGGRYRKPSRKLILDKIDLVVNKGDKIGVFGANGAGKSTLMKVVSGILTPTTGRVRTRGKISPLIELGAGFDADLSVRDNIILYGVMLGCSRQEMKERTQSILEFSELEDYSLHPLKGLSSGMTARLGFSIATDVKPDILLLDEILSVGDERFKEKCRHRIETLWNPNTSVILVTHDLNTIRQLCHRGIWLDKGRIMFAGEVNEAADQYLDFVRSDSRLQVY